MATSTLSVAQAQTDFAKKVASGTGLDPRVVYAWAQAKEAYAENGTGHYNFLNVRPATGGRSYSGVPLAGVSPGGFQEFNSPDDAATEVIHWINTMPNYAGLRAAKGTGVKTQLAAIAASPWDQNHYNGGKNLLSAFAATALGGRNFTDSIGDTLGGAAGHIPGVAQAKDAAGGIGDIATTFSNAVRDLTNPHLWLRTGYILGGGVLVFSGVVLLARAVGGAVAEPVAQVAEPVVKTVAAVNPELRAASKAAKTAKPARRGVPKRTESIDANTGRTRAEERSMREARRTSRSGGGDDIPF